MTDKWLIQAKELANNRVKTEDGLLSLRYDLREIANHFIDLGEEYINYNIKKGNYDTDPNCENRLSINELEAITKMSDFKYYSTKLFEFKKDFNIFNDDEVNAVIDELFEKNILEKSKNSIF